MKKYKKENKNFNKKQLTVIFSFCILILVVCGIYVNTNSAQYIVSENAVVDSKMISVCPKISGNVVHVYVENNQEVKKGDLILEIDPTYYEMQLSQARLKLQNAREKLNENSEETPSKLSMLQNRNKPQISKFSFSKHKFNQYESNYEENEPEKVIKEDKTSLIDNEPTKTKSVKNEGKSETSLGNKSEAEEKINDEDIDIKKLESEVEQAKLNLSYTKVYASRDGIITNRSVDEGDYIDSGQPVFSIIPKRVWVLAGFKISDKNVINQGQTAIIKLPSYPYKKFKGVVESVQLYSKDVDNLLPSQNSTDDFNRIYVRISFVEDYSAYNIKPTSNVVVKIKTSDK